MAVPDDLPKRYVLDIAGNAVRNPALEPLRATLRAGEIPSGVKRPRTNASRARTGISAQARGR